MRQMRRKASILALVIVVFVALAAFALFVSQFSLSALNEPSSVETYFASRAKHILVAKSARTGIPRAPMNIAQSRDEGERLYAEDCSTCHGVGGHTPTDSGRWMYPRAADLTSTEVQSWSDPELFWILKNGIRLSGMPAFAKVETDEHIWNLVHYLRSLPASQQSVANK